MENENIEQTTGAPDVNAVAAPEVQEPVATAEDIAKEILEQRQKASIDAAIDKSVANNSVVDDGIINQFQNMFQDMSQTIKELSEEVSSLKNERGEEKIVEKTVEKNVETLDKSGSDDKINIETPDNIKQMVLKTIQISHHMTDKEFDLVKSVASNAGIDLVSQSDQVGKIVDAIEKKQNRTIGKSASQGQKQVDEDVEDALVNEVMDDVENIKTAYGIL